MRSYFFIILAFLIGCSSLHQDNYRGPSNLTAKLSCNEVINIINHHAPNAERKALQLLRDAKNKNQLIHIDIGGEGKYIDAININPYPLTSTTGEPGRKIPRWVYGKGESIPLPTDSVHKVSLENAPISQATMAEILRVLQPRGEIHLSHPDDYANTSHTGLIEYLDEYIESLHSVTDREGLTKTVIFLKDQY